MFKKSCGSILWGPILLDCRFRAGVAVGWDFFGMHADLNPFFRSSFAGWVGFPFPPR
jgi:hypothetical protein